MAKKKGMNRRQFLKAGAGAVGVGAAMVGGLGFPQGARAAKAKLKDPIKIACLGTYSGAMGLHGAAMSEGALLAIDEIHGKGGILGSKIMFDFRDCELKTDITAKNARYFVNTWGADFIVGLDTSGDVLAVGEIAGELNRIIIATHGSTNKFNEDLVYKRGIKQNFRASIPLYHDGNGAAFIAKDYTDVKRWAAIVADYEWGHTCYKLYKSTLKQLRPDVEFVGEALAKFGTVDFSSQIAKVMALRPDGLLILEWGGEGVAVVKQCKLFGAFEKTKVCIMPMLGTIDVLMGLGRECPEGIWGTTRYWFLYPETSRNKEFVQNYYTRWKKYPHQNAENTYTAIYMIKEAVEKAKSLEIDKLISALEGMKVERPAGPCYIRKEDHQAVLEVPWGQTGFDPKYPFAILKNLKVFPAEKIYRNPPFPPIE
jgi:branched-chain amino acid transport system substrate-binding protein